MCQMPVNVVATGGSPEYVTDVPAEKDKDPRLQVEVGATREVMGTTRVVVGAIRVVLVGAGVALVVLLAGLVVVLDVVFAVVGLGNHNGLMS